MPLHISIDVDVTLLNEDGKLVAQARESLAELKAADTCLQLWSTGGADYAKAKAEENDLSKMFESYATKPDLAVDDEPENAHPLATIAISSDFTLADASAEIRRSIAQCADAALSPPSKPILQFVEYLQSQNPRTNPQFAGLFRHGRPLLPIPFFGPLEHARILTVGLNPSSDEFAPWRNWDDPRWGRELTWRMHNYFRLVRPRPHPWFAPLQEALFILNCPYKLAAAHVDISPWASFSPRYLQQTNPQLLAGYNALIDAGMEMLPSLIRLSKQPRLILIYHCGSRAEAARAVIQNSWPQGAAPRIEVMPDNKTPADWVNEKRGEFQELVGFKNIFE
jgi:hypothetical protein